jgi:hypothetical protein
MTVITILAGLGVLLLSLTLYFLCKLFADFVCFRKSIIACDKCSRLLKWDTRNIFTGKFGEGYCLCKDCQKETQENGDTKSD